MEQEPNNRTETRYTAYQENGNHKITIDTDKAFWVIFIVLLLIVPPIAIVGLIAKLLWDKCKK